ncbi:hypothetical protein [Rathayibacter soli]|uniref:hypothetical protein n=1 Tax=Rathayibacter soli TaxID=3144168 RepID=UPI0027E547BD|nr:hypothetical protein [Glaciibacter superstes]
MNFSSAELISLACVPLLMILASVFENRFGATVAGMIASAPVTAAVGLVAVTTSMGLPVGRDMALHMAGYAPAQVGFALVVAWSTGRLGITRALLIGIPAFGALAWIATLVPPIIAVAASLAALAGGRRLLPPTDKPVQQTAPARTGPWMITVRAAIALTATAGLLVAAHQFGPAVGGAVGAFPIFTATLCVFIFTKNGLPAMRSTLTGLVQGLTGYVAFVLTYWVATNYLGALAGAIVAAIVCLASYGLISRIQTRHPLPAVADGV